jgi:hypothetical protein
VVLFVSISEVNVVSDAKYLLGGVIFGMFLAAFATGGTEAASQCLMPFMAIGIIIGVLLGMGMLIDPKGTESMVKDSVEYWKDHLTDED